MKRLSQSLENSLNTLLPIQPYYRITDIERIFLGSYSIIKTHSQMYLERSLICVIQYEPSSDIHIK
jgi:hypothetical protein